MMPGKFTYQTGDLEMVSSPKAPDEFDINVHKFGVAPGDNKFHASKCPTCGKPPSNTPLNMMPVAFLFRDKLSTEEYRISDMCQACQDLVFDDDEKGDC